MRAPLRLLMLVGLAAVILPLGSVAQMPPAIATSPMILDPVPISRVLLTPDQLATELERVRRGVLVQMPLAEFEQRLKDTARKQAIAANPPRLIEAKYRAKLIDDHLAGTGEWKLLYAGDRPGLLSVEPLQLAMRSARWPDNRRAVIDRFPNPDGTPGDLRLLVEPTGQPTVSLEWSARGVPEPGELRFSLRVPAAPLASLELELPADRTPTLNPSDLLLTGPFPSTRPEDRIWRIAFGSRTQLDLSLSRRDNPNQPKPLIRSRGLTRVEVLPGRTQATFDLELETLHGPVSQIVLECDPRLQPYDVRINQRESWELIPNADANQPSKLLIKLASPFLGGRLEILAIAPLPMATDAPRWTLPGVRIVDGIDRGETLELRIHPDLQLEDWSTGAFRLSRTDVAKDNTQVLSLVPAITESPIGRVRPSARPRLLGTEVMVYQHIDWHIEADRETITTRLRCEVRRGVLTQFPLMLPPGWLVDAVEITPRELAATFTVQNGPAPILLIELQRPLLPGQANEWRITLRAPGPRFPAVPLGSRETPRLMLSLVDVLPLAARLREATLSIRVNGVFQANLLNRPDGTSSTALTAQGMILGSAGMTALMPEIPPGGTAYRIQYRGVGPTTDGKLLLRPRPLRLRVECDQLIARLEPSAAIAPLAVRVAAQIKVIPESGSVSNLLIGSTSPLTGSVDWRVQAGTNRLADVQMIPAGMLFAWGNLFAATNPLDAVARLDAVRDMQGPWWKLRFVRPVQESLTLTARLTGSTPPAAIDRRPVPLVWVAGVESMQNRVTLPGHAQELPPVQTRGLTLEPPSRLAADGVPDRAWSYAPFPLGMHLGTGTATPNLAVPPRLDAPHLLAILDRERLLIAFRVRLTNFPQREFRAQLPPGASLVAAVLDGRSLDGPEIEPINEPEPAAVAPLTVRFALPRSNDLGGHTLELVYRLPIAPWSLIATIDAPAPMFPLPLPDVTRVWRLAPGLSPASFSGWNPSPADSVPQNWLSLSPSAVRSWIEPPTPDSRTSNLAPLMEAASPWSAGPIDSRPRLGSFGDWLARVLTQGTGPERIGLVIDTEALREVGLSPQTALPATGPAPSPVWDAFGLALVACGRHAILTTPRQKAFWESLPDGLPQPLILAVATAITTGQDATGRFRNVADWLDSGNRDEDAFGGSVTKLLAPMLAPTWKTWLPASNVAIAAGNVAIAAGSSTGESMSVIIPFRMTAVGWGLSLGILLTSVTWALGRPVVGRAMLLIALMVLGIIWLRGPLAWQLVVRPMFLATVGITLMTLLRHRFSLRNPPVTAKTATGSNSRKSGGGSGRLVRCLLPITLASMPLFAQAAGNESTIVYLMPPTASEVMPTQVLVPRSLLQTLDTLDRRSVPVPGVVITSVHYEGKPADGVALFDAIFSLRCITEEPTTLSLPIAGVQMREALLDGAIAFPTRPIVAKLGGFGDTANDRYLLEVTGKGSHQLIIRFAVPIIGAEIDREVRFGIPELPQSRLSFDVPGSPKQLQAINWRGAQQLFALPAGQRLEADLGRTRTVQIRWRQDGPMPTTALVRVQEVSQWDIDEASARLVATLQYRITQGSVSTLKIALPTGLEVGRIEIQPQTTALASTPTSWLRDWNVGTPSGSTRPILTVQLQSPLSGVVRVHLELLPLKPLGNRPKLEFPTAVEAAETESYLAFRLNGVGLGPVQTQGVSEYDTGTFFRDLWQPGSFGKSQGPPTKAYQRTRGESGKITPTLLPLASPVKATQRLRWGVGLNRANLIADAEWIANPDPLMLVEWEVPAGVLITEVNGPNLRSWTRNGSRVQIWLQQPLTLVQMQMRGSISFAALPPPGLSTRLDVPTISLPGVTSTDTTIELQPQDGIALVTENLTQLAEEPIGDDGRILRYRTQTPSYTGRFTVWGPQPGSGFRLVQLLESRDNAGADNRRSLIMEGLIEATLANDRPHRFRIDVRNPLKQPTGNVAIAAGAFELIAPNGVRAIRRDLPESTTWEIEVPIRPIPKEAAKDSSKDNPMTEQSALIFQVRSLDSIDPREREVAQIRLLDVDDISDRNSALLVLVGPECRMLDGFGVRPQPPTALPLFASTWNDRLTRPGTTVWRMRSEDWSMRVQVGPARLAPEKQVQIGLIELETAHDPAGWVYRTTIELFHTERVPLTVQLPFGSKLQALALDGVDQPLPLASSLVTLSLPDEPGIRLVQVIWRLTSPIIGPDRPDLQRPRLSIPAGPLSGPTLVTVMQPAGCRIDRWSIATGPTPKPISPAVRQLQRADAQLRLAEWMQSLPISGSGPASPRLIPTLVPLLRAERLLRLAEFQRIGPRTLPADSLGEDRLINDALAAARAQLSRLRGLPGPQSSSVGVPSFSGMDLSERTWSRLPASDAFEAGSPITWLSDEEIRIDRIVPIPSDPPASRPGQLITLISAGIIGLISIAVFGRRGWPEQLAIVGLMAAVTLGEVDGLIFFLVPISTTIVRIVQLIGRFARSGRRGK